MTRGLHVWLNGVHTADVQLSAGQLRLRYAPDAQPLSLSMPVQEQHGHAVVSAWLDGLTPDDGRVLERWGRAHQVAPTAFALLATPVGLDCAGAVQFTPEGRSPGDRDSGVRWLEQEEIDALGEDLASDPTGWGARVTGGRFSLAGAQAKVALHVDGDRVGVPFGDEPSNVIVKPAIPGFVGHEVNEHLCMSAARACGVEVAPTRLWRAGRVQLLMVGRFDRSTVEGSTVRRHQEDLCQALGIPPGRRYQNEGGPTPRDVARLLMAHQRPAVSRVDRERFAEALLVNWLFAATDAHAKNFSLLLHRSGPRLAPLYDVASIAPYEDPLGAKLAMKLGGEYRLKAITGVRYSARMARGLGVDEDWAVQRARDLAVRLPDALRDRATADGLATDAMAVRLIDAVIAHIRRSLPA